jgi:predicted 3-demethylubiquinone-9 3-methyltransferase (glyoxalase superfamily)
MQKIVTFLWFDNNAEEAAAFYCSVFKDGKIMSLMKGPNNMTMGVTFQLDGQEFFGLNGGPQFKFTEATSLFVKCKDQQEVDDKWEKLIAGGGVESRCGWLKDKYGLSWQIIPDQLGKMIADPDRAKADRAFQSMLTMKKIDISTLERAFEGKS